MKFLDALLLYIHHSGVRHIFGVSGFASSPILNKAQSADMTSVISKHEAGASWMAYQYALAADKPFGVVAVCVLLIILLHLYIY